MLELDLDEEITLRLIQESDAGELFELTEKSRAELREWLPWVDGTQTKRDSLAFIQHSLEAYEARRSLNCGIIYNGKLCGMLGFNLVDWPNRVGHIGYWLATDMVGRGIMSRAVSGLIHYGFYELDLNRMEIRAAIGNWKSRAIPERLKFKDEGTVRESEWLYDHFVDHVVYGMLRSEWE